jgi:hypothetical protein
MIYDICPIHPLVRKKDPGQHVLSRYWSNHVGKFGLVDCT